MKKTIISCHLRDSLRSVLGICTIMLTIFLCSSCSNNTNVEDISSNGVSLKDQLVGSWYINGETTLSRDGIRGPAFTLYDDGTCEIASEYGTGSWSVVNDNQLKITSFYGETAIAVITSVEDGCLTISDDDSDAVTIYYSRVIIDDEAEPGNIQTDGDTDYVEQEVISMRDYHNGLAWIVYSELGSQYIACINKSGEVVFQYRADSIDYATDFSNDHAYLVEKNTLYTIDKTGKIIAKYNKDGVNIRCYEDGYVLIEKEVSGFDSKSFEYTIYNKNGSIIEQFSHEKVIDPIVYCGKGIFAFQLTPNYGDPTDYYFAEIQKWVNAPSSLTPYFYGDTAIIATTYRDVGDIRKGGILVMSSDGECFEYICDKLSDWAVYPSAINEGVCTLYDDGRIVTIILPDKSIGLENSYVLEEEYSKRIVDRPTPDSYMIHDGRIVLHLRGEDGKIYAGVFDKELKLMFQPILGSFSTYADGLLLVESNGLISMYDIDGNVVYSLTEKGYTTSREYSDNAILVDNADGQMLYLDKNGNPLFNQVDFKNVKTLSTLDSMN